jgi:hypothetical protein
VVNLSYSLVEGPVVGARGGRLRPSSTVVMTFVDDTHQLHPGVVLCVAPYTTGLPHGDGSGYCDTFASRHKPGTPLISVEGVMVELKKTFLLTQRQRVRKLFLLLLRASKMTAHKHQSTTLP